MPPTRRWPGRWLVLDVGSSRAVASENLSPDLSTVSPSPHPPEAASARLKATLSRGCLGASRGCAASTGRAVGERGRGSLLLTREITGAAPSSGLPSVPGPLPGLLTSERGVRAHGRLSRRRAWGGPRSAGRWAAGAREEPGGGESKAEEERGSLGLSHGRGEQRGRASEHVSKYRGIHAAHGPRPGQARRSVGSGAADRPPLPGQPPEPQSRARRRQTEGPGSCRSPVRCPHPGASIINYQASYIDNLIIYLLLSSFQIRSSIFTRA